jgi:SAM-dependent methyltransferase
MHYTAMHHGKLFFETYLVDRPGTRILDLGSQDVNGSLRTVAPSDCTYIGADFIEARGVDVVLTDAYALPFESESFDACVSSSCFEHAEFFWLAFNEALRVLKPNGLFLMNAPSNGNFHRYPVDCWRFYPDAGKALENWGKRSGYNPSMLECFTGRQKYAGWNDYVAVFLKDEGHAEHYPRRILDHYTQFTNGMMRGRSDILNLEPRPEDRRKIHWPRKIARLFNRGPKSFDLQ